VHHRFRVRHCKSSCLGLRCSLVGIYGSGDSVDVLLKIQNESFRFLNDGSDKFWLFLAGALNAPLCVRPQGSLKTGHTEGMDCGRKLGCGKAGSCAALEVAPRFPLSHNLNNNITLSVDR